MASRRSGREATVAVVHDGAVEVVAVRGGGTALRIHGNARSAAAAGLPARLARDLFRAEAGKDPCGGDCNVAFSATRVWCEPAGCNPRRCECRLREMWKDRNGKWHDDDRGARGPKSKYPRRKKSFYRCICKAKRKAGAR